MATPDSTSTLQYESAQQSLPPPSVTDHSRLVPFLGSDARQEFAPAACVNLAASPHDVVLPAGAEPVAQWTKNVELQLVVANSEFRVKQTEFKDKPRPSRLEAAPDISRS
jgi:hypothetical protein